MGKIVKHLKPFIGGILVSFILLFFQAVCDLSLPDYMSHIVNIGIQQGGIENAVPKVISSTEMERLFLFMSDEDKNTVKSNYDLLDKATLSSDDYDKYVKDYPSLENETIYKLNTDDKDKIADLNGIFPKPMMLTYSLEEGGISAIPGAEDKIKQAEQAQEAQVAAAKAKGIEIPADKLVDFSKMTPFDFIKMMPADQLTTMRDSINAKFDDMPASMLTQGATKYVKQVYGNIGIDTGKISSNYVLLAGAKMLGIALLSMLATVAVGYIGSRIAASLGRNLRRDIFGKVVSFSNNEFDKFSTASLITRTTNDIQQIQMLTVMIIRIVFYAPILGVGGFIKVLSTKTSMGWILGVAVLAMVSLVGILFGLAVPKFKGMQKLIDKLNLVTRESLTGLLVVRAFNTQKVEEEKFDKANMDLTKTNLFVNRVMAFMMPGMMVVMNCISILIVWVGAHRIDQGILQVGDMMAFIQYAMQIIMAFLMISMISIMLPRASVSAQRIGEVLSTDLSVTNSNNPKKFNADGTPVVEFKNVTFKYPGAEEPVLENITFTAKPGETTAFIGSTGSGKSTLINLIPRFYDATEGEILIDGVNIKEVTQSDLRDKVGYAPQKGILFTGTIESNIKYSDQNLSNDKMAKAAEIAQATEFISSKEEGYDTHIAQGGNNVSGGQKQRLSIARALAKDPEIYIFDDSFSALDFKTDAALRRALKSETQESTVLIVAQRISTIMNAEQIIVLDEGKMVGKGTHKELLENCEVYQQIALSQLSKEELGNE